jgi:RNA polymerase sigma factor (sigma-70 family)
MPAASINLPRPVDPARTVEPARLDASDPIQTLCARVASGDPEAFSRFYRAWFDRCEAEARRATGRDEAFCLDIVQDAMMRVIRSMPRAGLDGDDAVAAWLRTVVRSCAYDRLRAERRRTAREARRGPAIDRSSSATHHRPNEVDQQLAWLARELASLPREQARLVHLRYRLGWTLARIGRATGLTASAADGRIGRAVAAIRRRADKEFSDEP